ncbi:aldose epimerase family protein [Oscillospiraceae bacterium PP1C4]
MTTITSRPFFQTDTGAQAVLYTMKNAHDVEVEISSFGGAIVAIRVPDRNGKFADVVLGYDDYEGYRSKKYFLGAMVGRCCNRIGNGRFTLGEKTYQLALNDNGKHHLHGGDLGLESKLWDCEIVKQGMDEVLRLRTVLADGEEHYPARLEIELTCALTDENQLILHYTAMSDADTICNLTNHSYFNIEGHDSETILHHQLKLYADRFTETDSDLIPTGRVLPVEDTPMDFREFHEIGERIDEDYEPLHYGGGYDHNWVLNTGNRQMGICAELYAPVSGRHLTCYTDKPCIQIYTGNGMDGTQAGKDGCYYGRRSGIALETQFSPDAINHPEWDSPVLKAGQVYDYTTIFKFDIKPY